MKRLFVATILFAATATAAGVKVRFDPFSAATGLFPSKSLTVADPAQITGVRVNVPLPDCAASRHVRQKENFFARRISCDHSLFSECPWLVGGQWTYEGEYKPGPLGPGGKAVGAIVIHHQMQRYLAGKLAVDAAQELQKLLMPVTLIAVTDNFSSTQSTIAWSGGFR